MRGKKKQIVKNNAVRLHTVCVGVRFSMKKTSSSLNHTLQCTLHQIQQRKKVTVVCTVAILSFTYTNVYVYMQRPRNTHSKITPCPIASNLNSMGSAQLSQRRDQRKMAETFLVIPLSKRESCAHLRHVRIKKPVCPVSVSQFVF